MLHGLAAEVTQRRLAVVEGVSPKKIGSARIARITNGFKVFAGVCFNHSNLYGLRQRETPQ